MAVGRGAQRVPCSMVILSSALDLDAIEDGGQQDSAPYILVNQTPKPVKRLLKFLTFPVALASHGACCRDGA